eukprot:NODE_593_length_5604_cov_0.739691.p1 type:complete len:383 gc:universal NODE_593_length_5604_cov_0.739691:1198-50(-)
MEIAIQECCQNLGITRDEFDATWQSYALNNGINVSELTDSRLQSFRTILYNQIKRKKPQNNPPKDISSGGISLLISGMSSEGHVSSVNRGEVIYRLGEIDYSESRIPGTLTAPIDEVELYKAFFITADSDREMFAEELDNAYLDFENVFSKKAKDNNFEIELAPVDSISQEDVLTFGRILILPATDDINDDTPQSKEKQACLICPSDLGRGVCSLEFMDLKADLSFWKFADSIFSGQICGLIGKNTSGRSFQVKSILHPKIPMYKNFPESPTNNIVSIASGPFGNSRGLIAFDSAIQEIASKKPDYAIFNGPFVHEDSLKELELFPDDMYNIFISKLAKLSELLPNTKFIITSSPFEAISSLCTYPSPKLIEMNDHFQGLVI